MHTGVDPEHAVPQLPQFLGSVEKSTHAPLQRLVPGKHTHVPALQLSADGHVVVQEPQWLGSVCSSTHPPLQFDKPWLQLEEQTPRSHTWPFEHALPHLPQLAGSLVRSEHVPLHETCPIAVQIVLPSMLPSMGMACEPPQPP